MKNHFRLTVLAAGLLGSASCADNDPLKDERVAQCKAIAENYSPVIGYQAVNYDGSTVELKLTVKSAIKELDGYISCSYSYPSVPVLPSMVMIGKTKHTEHADIHSLVNGEYLDGRGFPKHSH